MPCVERVVVLKMGTVFTDRLMVCLSGHVSAYFWLTGRTVGKVAALGLNRWKWMSVVPGGLKDIYEVLRRWVRSFSSSDDEIARRIFEALRQSASFEGKLNP